MTAENKSLEETISDIIISIGIPPSIVGSAYMNEAVRLAIEQPKMLICITKSLYAEVAKKFDTKVANVERGIRHAIDVAWNKNRIITLNKIFNMIIYKEYERPCNSEIIALLAERIPHLMRRNAKNLNYDSASM